MSSFLERRLNPTERYGLRLTLMVIAFLIIVLPFGLLLTQVTEEGDVPDIDATVSQELHEWVRGRPLLINTWKAITNLGSPAWFYVLVGGAAFYMWRRGHPRIALFLVATGLLGGLLNSTVKVIVDRPRPTWAEPVATAGGMSFPSGHAMAVTVNYGALLLAFIPLMARKWRPFFIGLGIAIILAVGISRLVLGVHYVTDVLGGYLLGAAWLALSTAAFSVWRAERGKSRVEPEEGLAPEIG